MKKPHSRFDQRLSMPLHCADLLGGTQALRESKAHKYIHTQAGTHKTHTDTVISFIFSRRAQRTDQPIDARRSEIIDSLA